MTLVMAFPGGPGRGVPRQEEVALPPGGKPCTGGPPIGDCLGRVVAETSESPSTDDASYPYAWGGNRPHTQAGARKPWRRSVVSPWPQACQTRP